MLGIEMGLAPSGGGRFPRFIGDTSGDWNGTQCPQDGYPCKARRTLPRSVSKSDTLRDYVRTPKRD
ncbi:MAG: hypothetical protein IJP76_01540 [Paludibacteraceae bacterium]|nr:hypothetical protein [Paludibacteraceae bacterium]